MTPVLHLQTFKAFVVTTVERNKDQAIDGGTGGDLAIGKRRCGVAQQGRCKLAAYTTALPCAGSGTNKVPQAASLRCGVAQQGRCKLAAYTTALPGAGSGTNKVPQAASVSFVQPEAES